MDSVSSAFKSHATVCLTHIYTVTYMLHIGTVILSLQIFWDLASLSAYEQDMDSKLVINMDKVLGRGGFGFVCEGELHMKVSNSFLLPNTYFALSQDSSVFLVQVDAVIIIYPGWQ